MAINRRRLLAATAAGFGWALIGRVGAAVAGPRGPLWLGAYADSKPEPDYGVAAFDATGRIAFACPLPGRGHGITPHPDGTHAVVMARRPGRWFAVLNLSDGRLTRTVALPDDRRGTGHGVYDAAGAAFFMAEDDAAREIGVLTRLDPAAGYARRESFDCGGVGPHEVLALDGGRLLAAANGGVLTHPDTGRVKLNLDDMDSSLTYIDAADGRIVETIRLDPTFGNLGVRHLAALADGTVAFGVQDERPTGELQPLVGQHRRGEAPVLLSAPDAVWRRFAGYVGSMAGDGRHIVASSPRGGVVGRWDGITGDWLGLSELPDGCGVAAAGDGDFVASSGRGRIVALSGRGAAPIADTAGFRWDNHLSTAVAQR